MAATIISFPRAQESNGACEALIEILYSLGTAAIRRAEADSLLTLLWYHGFKIVLPGRNGREIMPRLTLTGCSPTYVSQNGPQSNTIVPDAVFGAGQTHLPNWEDTERAVRQRLNRFTETAGRPRNKRGEPVVEDIAKRSRHRNRFPTFLETLCQDG